MGFQRLVRICQCSIQRFGVVGENGSTHIAPSPDGKWIAIANFAGVIRIWDPTSGKELRRFRSDEGAGPLAFSPDSKTLASAGYKTIDLWDPATGKILHKLQGHLSTVSSVCYSPDGKTLASGSGDTTVILWDLTKLKDNPK